MCLWCGGGSGTVLGFMMTSAQIRQSYLDFFKSKLHTIVQSSSLMPDSPNLLFTNAGMNQFVPIFLGQVRCPYTPGRAADTQKCIRAGGKHNDLEDVGLDTYHHTFFEMLGNWSFGDYFKKEAIEWAWELITQVWKFPVRRVYATVYSPDKSIGDPSEFDQEAYDFWAEKFTSVGLDPKVHIVYGNKKDNFWMMGETGPCGPCSELHIDLTPEGDTKGALVNKGSPKCIEIWNLVFIQFNANPDGTFAPLPAKHVDTGMGFERVTSIIQGTNHFSDFANAKISNYETDIFRPIFDRLEQLSGKKYTSTLPVAPSTGDTEQEKIDVAFRVIADHIRTLSFAIADGIIPGNTDRNYVLRRILRRAVKYGRTLGFSKPFFSDLVEVLVRNFGAIFPEIQAREKFVRDVILGEEIAFNRTLDTGLKYLEEVIKLKRSSTLSANGNEVTALRSGAQELAAIHNEVFDDVNAGWLLDRLQVVANKYQSDANDLVYAGLIEEGEAVIEVYNNLVEFGSFCSLNLKRGVPKSDLVLRLKLLLETIDALLLNASKLGGKIIFKLYDTYGFPLDLTELVVREQGFKIDSGGFDRLMGEQRSRARAAQKKEVISLSSVETTTPTRFIGYDQSDTTASVLEVVGIKDKTAVILDASTLYAEMGGQVGDTGEISGSGQLWRVVNTQKSGNTWLHFVEGGDAPVVGSSVTLVLDEERRDAIQRHHTVTHLLHWALHEVVSKEASQKGSFVGPDKLTFDFNSAALTPVQVRDIEKLVNERILENGGVTWNEVSYASVKGRADVMQFFGDKYGDTVRLVEIGDYSKELCGGTHTKATGEIGLFRILGENAIAAGVRRIEAVAGLTAYGAALAEADLIRSIASKVNAPVGELEKKIETLLAHQKELERQIKSAQQKQAAGIAKELLGKVNTIGSTKAIVENLGEMDGDGLQSIIDALKGEFEGVIVLGSINSGAVALVANVSASLAKTVQAGKIIQTIAPIVGGKGGGRPESARGGGKDVAKLDEALAAAKNLLG